jgi:hypothetical protein
VPYGSRDTAQRFGGSAREPGGGVQRFDRSGQPRAEQGLGQRGGGVAAKPDRVGDRSIGGQDRAAQKSALGGGESRGRTQASSNRGYSSSWQSRGGGGGGGGATRGGGGGGRTRGGGRRR